MGQVMSSSTIKLQRNEWNKIRTRLKSEYPPSWTLLRDTMRRELGFTPRDHKVYDQMRHHYIDFVVDDMPAKQLTWALSQCQQSYYRIFELLKA